MPSTPSPLSLANIPSGGLIVSVDHRNNYSAIQTLCNALVTILAGGTAGQVLGSQGGTTIAWGAAGGPGAPATTLPGSPTDGQQAVLTDSTSAPTYAWLLQWSAAAAKWLYLGGSPGFAEVTTPETTASATYAALATAGPSFTVPRAGTYEVALGCTAQTSAGSGDFTARMSYDIGGTGAVDADAVASTFHLAAAGDHDLPASASRTREKTGVAAATALVAKYKVTGGTVSLSNRWLSVRPVAVT